MNAELSDKLSELADKLNVGIESLWGALINQASISSSVHLFFLFWFCVLCFFLWCFVLKKVRQWEEYTAEEQENIAGVFVVSLILTTILILVAVVNLPTIISGFVNPEYWAINELKGFLN